MRNYVNVNVLYLNLQEIFYFVQSYLDFRRNKSILILFIFTNIFILIISAKNLHAYNTKISFLCRAIDFCHCFVLSVIA